MLGKPATRVALAAAVSHWGADLICLQETKLQETHESAARQQLIQLFAEQSVPEWQVAEKDIHFSSSTARKGYSGTAMIVNPAVAPDGYTVLRGLETTNAGTDTDAAELAMEGRALTVATNEFSVTNVYAPNSGAALARLDTRLDVWDRELGMFMKRREVECGWDQGRMNLLVGDLNVAYGDADYWHDRLSKANLNQAGLTAQERASFGLQILELAGLADVFRELHPEAYGHFSYFSRRARGHLTNKGLRIDYQLVAKQWWECPTLPMPRERCQSCIVETPPEASDHRPVVARFCLDAGK